MSTDATSSASLGLGVDIGGSGMKAAIVDLVAGDFVGERVRIPTPRPATPTAMQSVFADLQSRFDYDGPVGCTFPGVVRGRSVIETAANLDSSWISTDASSLFGGEGSADVAVLNDADAAALAEVRFGAAKGVDGVVMVLTLGTGIGSGLVHNGVVVPNTELGHLELGGVAAETRAASRVRESEDLSWSDWGQRVNTYLQHVEFLFSPDLFVLGGGVSKNFDHFATEFDLHTPVVPAQLRNRAGIIGAALFAADL